MVRWWRRWPVRQRALVNLDDGRAFDGILYDQRGPLLEMVDARLIDVGGEPVQLDGRVYVERSKVSFIQVR